MLKSICGKVEGWIVNTSKKLKIVMFSETYIPQVNGVATSIHLFRKYLEHRGHDVYVIAPVAPESDDRVLLIDGITFPTERQHKLPIPSNRMINDFIYEIKPDVIHSHAPFTLGFAALRVQKKFGIPHVHTYHTLLVEYRHYIPKPITPPKDAVEEFSAWFCNQVDHVISPTSEIKTELQKYGVERPITVLPTGIDTESFEKPDKFDIRKKHEIPPDHKILLFVGRLAKEKNLGFILEIFKELHKKFQKIKLIIVGDGPMKPKIEEYIADEEAGKNIILTGYIKRDNLIEYYKQSDLFVFASVTETQGLVVLESLAAGTPVVAVAKKGIKDVLMDGQGALLINDVDKYEFLKKVEKLLKDEDLLNNLSVIGKEYVKNYWSMEIMTERLEKLYLSLEKTAVSSKSFNLSIFTNMIDRFSKIGEKIFKVEEE
jgi:glycosyltransferase involved in cell wall biosynthesis